MESNLTCNKLPEGEHTRMSIQELVQAKKENIITPLHYWPLA